MEQRMIKRLIEIIYSKCDEPCGPSRMVEEYIQVYISSMGLVQGWENAGLDEKYFDEWFELFTEPFRLLDYFSCFVLLKYNYEIKYFDRMLLIFQDIENNSENKKPYLIAENIYSRFTNLCSTSVFLKGENFTEKYMDYATSVITAYKNLVRG